MDPGAQPSDSGWMWTYCRLCSHFTVSKKPWMNRVQVELEDLAQGDLLFSEVRLSPMPAHGFICWIFPSVILFVLKMMSFSFSPLCPCKNTPKYYFNIM